MCRLVAYMGQSPLLLADLIHKPINSLIAQSCNAKIGHHVVNADGFGLSWYQNDIESNPALFRSTHPAWNDSNLMHLTKKVRSQCFLAHVRASTVGSVAVNNCHPFIYQNYSFAHNGTIENFQYLRLALAEHIGPELAFQIKAETDSEHLFFLIIYYAQLQGSNPCLKTAVRQAFSWIEKTLQGIEQLKNTVPGAMMNILLTDGQQFISTRFSFGDLKCPSLYVSSPHTWPVQEQQNTFPELKGPYMMIASEPLTDDVELWRAVPDKTLISYQDNTLNMEAL